MNETFKPKGKYAPTIQETINGWAAKPEDGFSKDGINHTLYENGKEVVKITKRSDDAYSVYLFSLILELEIPGLSLEETKHYSEDMLGAISQVREFYKGVAEDKKIQPA